MQVTKQLESGENPSLTNEQYLQQLKDEMFSYSKKQDKVRNVCWQIYHLYNYQIYYITFPCNPVILSLPMTFMPVMPDILSLKKYKDISLYKYF